MVHPFEKARVWLIKWADHPKFKRLDIRCWKSMQLTWFLGMQTHATFVVKFGNADRTWNNALQWKVVQCSWHSFPILWFWFWFWFNFLENKDWLSFSTDGWYLIESTSTPSICAMMVFYRCQPYFFYQLEKLFRLISVIMLLLLHFIWSTFWLSCILM